MNFFGKLVLLIGTCLIGQSAVAQTTPNLMLNFGTARVSTTRAGYNEIDVLISAGTGYVSDAAGTTSPNNSNASGSWSAINFRFTQSGPNTMSNTDFYIVNQQASTTATNVSSVAGAATTGGCYYGAPAFNISVTRTAGQDADNVPRVLFTLQFPATYSTQKLNIRETTASCTTRDSFWANTSNTGTRRAIRTTTLSSPLPVTLTAFTATKRGGNGRISWHTASEYNSEYFMLQVSRDGRTWQPLHKQPAMGNSTTPREYDYLDKNLTSYAAPVVYYRLQQVDIDGQTQYSPVAMLRVNATNEWKVSAYPVPFGQTLTAQLLTTEVGPVTVELSDLTGRVVLQRTLIGELGSQLIHLDEARHLPSGTYVLQLKQHEHVKSIRVVRE